MKKLIFLILLSLVSVRIYSQQDPIYTQYIYNTLAINPAYAGTSEALSINLLERIQWVGFDGGPNTLTLTANTNLPNPHLGIGLTVFRDALGPTVETGVLGSFSYRIIFPKGKLSFGIQFGFDYMDVDWSSLVAEDPNDPLITSQVKDKAVPDAGFGMYYYSDKFYVGLSSTHLFQNKLLVAEEESDDFDSFSRLLRHFYISGGYVIPVSDEVILRPAALIKYVDNAPIQADLNVNLLIHDVVWLGAGYRTENSINLMAELVIAKNLRIGYSYDIWFNSLKAYNKGSHEIHLGFDVDIFKTERMVRPKYF